jgi:hypothetical protein
MGFRQKQHVCGSVEFIDHGDTCASSMTFLALAASIFEMTFDASLDAGAGLTYAHD